MLSDVLDCLETSLYLLLPTNTFATMWYYLIIPENNRALEGWLFSNMCMDEHLANLVFDLTRSVRDVTSMSGLIYIFLCARFLPIIPKKACPRCNMLAIHMLMNNVMDIVCMAIDIAFFKSAQAFIDRHVINNESTANTLEQELLPSSFIYLGLLNCGHGWHFPYE